MEKDTIKIRSSIKPEIMKRTIIKGSAIAGIGASILLLTGIFMPLETLSTWGLPLLLFSGLLMTLGLLPYRKLCRLEKKPDELILSLKNLLFVQKGKPAMTIPLQSIEKTSYFEKGKVYGICVWLKHPAPEKITVHNNAFDAGWFEQDSRSRFQCDLFFPYFSERGYKEILD